MQFRDTKGRIWDITVTGREAKRWKQELEVNIFELMLENCKLLAKIAADPLLQIDMLYVATLGQHANVDADEFAAGLCGDALSAALEALWKAIPAFFPDARTRRPLEAFLAKSRAIGEKIMIQAESTAIQVMDSMDIEEMAKTWNAGSSSFADSPDSGRTY